jgi:L-asparagine oxygenase
MAGVPLDVISTIQAFHTSPDGPGALHIRGLPTDYPMSPTPAKGGRANDKPSFISESCLISIASIIGDVFSYATEKNGELIHNVCPVRSGEKTQSNESSKVNLDLHIENAYFENRPDYLALYCLRQDHEKRAKTYLADVRVALQKLSPETIAELRKPVFLVPSPDSHHKAQGGPKWSRPRPLIEGDSFESPTMLFRFPGMKALDHRGEEALLRFAEAINDPEIVFSIALQPGEMLLLNNRKVAHGRTYFEARYDGTDRWLQRVYIRGAHAPWFPDETSTSKLFER